MEVKIAGKCKNVKEREEVTYMSHKIVMDGGKRLRTLECLINNIPVDADCFAANMKLHKRQIGEGKKRTYVKKEEKEVITI